MTLGTLVQSIQEADNSRSDAIELLSYIYASCTARISNIHFEVKILEAVEKIKTFILLLNCDFLWFKYEQNYINKSLLPWKLY